MTKSVPAKPGDAHWTEGKQRCWDLLVIQCGGEHHMGNTYHWGRGLKMTWKGFDLSTFDSSELTSLVLLAHARHCRASVCPNGPRLLAIEVHPRESSGGFAERHPGLAELVQTIDRLTRHLDLLASER